VREDDLIVEPIQFDDGSAIVPNGPGLGCELDLEAVERYISTHLLAGDEFILDSTDKSTKRVVEPLARDRLARNVGGWYNVYE